MYHITSNDGTKIAVYDYNPQRKQTVFLIHGWPLSHQIFEYQTGLLTNCGYRVVAVDLRGFGQSDTPACGYCYDQLELSHQPPLQVRGSLGPPPRGL